MSISFDGADKLLSTVFEKNIQEDKRKAADKNNDGKISNEEIIAALKGQAGVNAVDVKKDKSGKVTMVDIFSQANDKARGKLTSYMADKTEVYTDADSQGWYQNKEVTHNNGRKTFYTGYNAKEKEWHAAHQEGKTYVNTDMAANDDWEKTQDDTDKKEFKTQQTHVKNNPFNKPVDANETKTETKQPATDEKPKTTPTAKPEAKPAEIPTTTTTEEPTPTEPGANSNGEKLEDKPDETKPTITPEQAKSKAQTILNAYKGKTWNEIQNGVKKDIALLPENERATVLAQLMQLKNGPAFKASVYHLLENEKDNAQVKEMLEAQGTTVEDLILQHSPKWAGELLNAYIKKYPNANIRVLDDDKHKIITLPCSGNKIRQLGYDKQNKTTCINTCTYDDKGNCIKTTTIDSNGDESEYKNGKEYKKNSNGVFVRDISDDEKKQVETDIAKKLKENNIGSLRADHAVWHQKKENIIKSVIDSYKDSPDLQAYAIAYVLEEASRGFTYEEPLAAAIKSINAQNAKLVNAYLAKYGNEYKGADGESSLIANYITSELSGDFETEMLEHIKKFGL